MRISSDVIITEVVDGWIEFLVAIGQISLFQLRAREIVLHFIVVTFVIVLLLAVLVGRLSDESPLRALIEQRQFESWVGPQNFDRLAAEGEFSFRSVNIDVLLLLDSVLTGLLAIVGRVMHSLCLLSWPGLALPLPR